MAEETLLTAARRVVRFFNIDMNGHGGLVSIETQSAVETLDMQVARAVRLEKLAEKRAEYAEGAAKAAAE